jgi:hypothetical protein
MDGIVMGHTCCAFDDCIGELADARQGVFCQMHEITHGSLCHIKGCHNLITNGIKTCVQHRRHW